MREKTRKPAGRAGRLAGTRSVGEVPGDDDRAPHRRDPDSHATRVGIEDVGDVVPLAGIRLGHELGMAPVERRLLAPAPQVALVLAAPPEAHAAGTHPAFARAPIEAGMAEVAICRLVPRMRGCD